MHQQQEQQHQQLPILPPGRASSPSHPLLPDYLPSAKHLGTAMFACGLLGFDPSPVLVERACQACLTQQPSPAHLPAAAWASTASPARQVPWLDPSPLATSSQPAAARHPLPAQPPSLLSLTAAPGGAPLTPFVLPSCLSLGPAPVAACRLLSALSVLGRVSLRSLGMGGSLREWAHTQHDTQRCQEVEGVVRQAYPDASAQPVLLQVGGDSIAMSAWRWSQLDGGGGDVNLGACVSLPLSPVVALEFVAGEEVSHDGTRRLGLAIFRQQLLRRLGYRLALGGCDGSAGTQPAHAPPITLVQLLPGDLSSAQAVVAAVMKQRAI
ncbi:hypothetical protein V8C86DRAFT_2901304 [Haematococcus lacustris]